MFCCLKSILEFLQMYPFPLHVVEPKFTAFFSTSGDNTRVTVPGTETRATATHLLFDSSYRIQVRAEYKYQYCANKVIGRNSVSVRATTVETGNPQLKSFDHVSKMSCLYLCIHVTRSFEYCMHAFGVY